MFFVGKSRPLLCSSFVSYVSPSFPRMKCGTDDVLTTPSKRSLGDVQDKRNPRFRLDMDQQNVSSRGMCRTTKSDSSPAKSVVTHDQDVEKQEEHEEEEKKKDHPIRTWSKTMLGVEVESGRRKVQPDEMTFTLMSHNVLADYLAQRHSELYRGISHDKIEWEARFRRIVEQIQTQDPDILCLQEVQNNHYLTHFCPQLEALGYAGQYKQRTEDDKLDGCAIFYKTDKFELVDTSSVEYYQPGVSVLDRHNVALLAKFRPRPSRKSKYDHHFCVATTHLLYNPRGHDIKLAQSAVLLAELDRFAYAGKERSRHSYYPVILTGDLNLTPDSFVYNFLEQGLCQYEGLSSRCLDFGPGQRMDNVLLPKYLGINDECQHVLVRDARRNKNKCLDDKGEQQTFLHHTSVQKSKDKVQNLLPYGSGSLSHAFGLRSVYKPVHGVSTLQNSYVMVDYIFYSTRFSPTLQKYIEGNLKLLARLKLLHGYECERMGGFPSETCPSDHLCLIANFLLKGIRTT